MTHNSNQTSTDLKNFLECCVSGGKFCMASKEFGGPIALKISLVQCHLIHCKKLTFGGVLVKKLQNCSACWLALWPRNQSLFLVQISERKNGLIDCFEHQHFV